MHQANRPPTTPGFLMHQPREPSTTCDFLMHQADKPSWTRKIDVHFEKNERTPLFSVRHHADRPSGRLAGVRDHARELPEGHFCLMHQTIRGGRGLAQRMHQKIAGG
jgi:hypothetical protein